MKYLLVLLSAALLSLMAFTRKTGTILNGKVTGETGEALIGASVKITKRDVFVKGAITDYQGNYGIPLEPGKYEAEFSYTGFASKRVIDVVLIAGKETTLNVALQPGSLLNEVIVTDFKVPVMEREKTAGGMTLTHEDSRKRLSGAKPKPASEPRRVMLETPSGKTSGPESPAPAMAKDAPLMERKAEIAFREMMSDDAPPRKTAPGHPAQPAPRSGLLTAGEWNDLHNWNNHWLDLQTDGEIDAYEKMYGFYPKQRYTLLLQNEQELPLTDAAVQLLDAKDAIVWEARTDNLGRAELWNGLVGQANNGRLSLRVWVDGQKHDLGVARPFSEGINRHKIQRACKHSNKVDIVWAVDATGSMGDELEYLKTELLDVISRVKTANPDLAVRMGSVFYRDKGDEYIVKSSALNHDIAKTVDYIRKQSAGGGGDYPEAVHSALEEAIYRQPWSLDAMTRICFLVLDASPHQAPEVRENLQRSIREAAKKGIRIVPVSASGIQKDTEFLMKFFGLATNGTYVFLTDHSGIGGKHLEPTTDEYKVELLNDLLVRLITEYSTVPDCQGKSTIRFEDREDQAGQQQPNPNPLDPIVYYPNPASLHFTLELPFDADKVTLYNAEGKAVRSLAQLSAGIHVVAVNDLNEGFYTLRIWKGAQVQSGKVVVVRA